MSAAPTPTTGPHGTFFEHDAQSKTWTPPSHLFSKSNKTTSFLYVYPRSLA